VECGGGGADAVPRKENAEVARRREGEAAQGGFTLIEILVALVVVGVATSVFIQLFSLSLTMARTSQNQALAATLADEQMNALLRAPRAYDWHLAGAAPGQLIAVTPRQAQEDHRHFDAPSTLPLSPRASNREEALHEKFSWEGYARLPHEDARCLEVTVAVRWVEEGRDRLISLTSAIARSAIAPAAEKGGAA
jgi:prepilin-type N-terminal cleavage/methylation domain-containing protein